MAVFFQSMLEIKKDERDRTVLGEGYCLGTWDIWVQLKSTWKTSPYGNNLWSLHHGISLQGRVGQGKARILDTCYHVLPHTLYPVPHNFQHQPCGPAGL